MSEVITGAYRIQVRPAFDLDTTAGITPYLSALVVSHLYSAPLLAATPGSRRAGPGSELRDHRGVRRVET